MYEIYRAELNYVTICLQQTCERDTIPDSKIHGANVGLTWGQQDPDGPHDGHMNFAIWDM